MKATSVVTDGEEVVRGELLAFEGVDEADRPEEEVAVAVECVLFAEREASMVSVPPGAEPADEPCAVEDERAELIFNLKWCIEPIPYR